MGFSSFAEGSDSDGARSADDIALDFSAVEGFDSTARRDSSVSTSSLFPAHSSQRVPHVADRNTHSMYAYGLPPENSFHDRPPCQGRDWSAPSLVDESARNHTSLAPATTDRSVVSHAQPRQSIGGDVALFGHRNPQHRNQYLQPQNQQQQQQHIQYGNQYAHNHVGVPNNPPQQQMHQQQQHHHHHHYHYLIQQSCQQDQRQQDSYQLPVRRIAQLGTVTHVSSGFGGGPVPISQPHHVDQPESKRMRLDPHHGNFNRATPMQSPGYHVRISEAPHRSQPALQIQDYTHGLTHMPPAQTSVPDIMPSSTLRSPHKAPCKPQLSALHQELVSFAEQAMPSFQEQAFVQQGLQSIRRVTSRIWPQSTTSMFGSQATGLALPGADLDIVVLGTVSELSRPGTGFSKDARETIVSLLEELLNMLLAAKPAILVGTARIVSAKVPIIKCKLAVGGGMSADISIGVANGARAVQYFNRQLQALPALRPLILLVKALLRERKRNEVFTGGFSSYTVASLCLAHLQADGLAVPASSGGRSQSAATSETVADDMMPAKPKKGQSHQDFGQILRNFLHRFGHTFSYEKQAVSIRQGGVIQKPRMWRDAKKLCRLAVEDPQEADKDIASGSFSVLTIQRLFRVTAEKLNKASSATAKSAADDSAGWAAVQAEGRNRSVSAPSRFPILSAIIDIDLALSRSPAAESRRANLIADKGFRKKGGKRRNGGKPAYGSTVVKRSAYNRQKAGDAAPYHFGQKSKKAAAPSYAPGEKNSNKRDKNRRHNHKKAQGVAAAEGSSSAQPTPSKKLKKNTSGAAKAKARKLNIKPTVKESAHQGQSTKQSTKKKPKQNQSVAKGGVQKRKHIKKAALNA